MPQAVIELQRRLPNSRVMYVSATGASEAENLCYMERLGLWGPGSAFQSKQEFVGLLKQGGIGAMELVAMELKGAGCYISRSLSWAVSQQQLHTCIQLCSGPLTGLSCGAGNACLLAHAQGPRLEPASGACAMLLNEADDHVATLQHLRSLPAALHSRRCRLAVVVLLCLLPVTLPAVIAAAATVSLVCLQDVRFETVAIDASEEFVSMYDAAVDVWQDTREFLRTHNLDKGRIMGGQVRTV